MAPQLFMLVLCKNSSNSNGNNFFLFLFRYYLDDDDVTTSGVTLDDIDKRIVFLNKPQPQKFTSNRISTAKYR